MTTAIRRNAYTATGLKRAACVVCVREARPVPNKAAVDIPQVEPDGSYIFAAICAEHQTQFDTSVKVWLGYIEPETATALPEIIA